MIATTKNEIVWMREKEREREREREGEREKENQHQMAAVDRGH